jgi:hypothetical protein
VAAGVALVAAALIGGLVLLIAGGGDGGGRQGAAPSNRVADLQNKLLKHTVVNARDGISVRRPANWADHKAHSVITLRSADRCVAINLSAPAGAEGTARLRRDSLRAVRTGFTKVRVGPGGRGQVGGIPTTSNTLELTDDAGHTRRVLLSVSKGENHSYLTEVVLGNPACADDLRVAQVVLTSVEFTK